MEECKYCHGTGNDTVQVGTVRGWRFMKCRHCCGTGKQLEKQSVKALAEGRPPRTRLYKFGDPQPIERILKTDNKMFPYTLTYLNPGVFKKECVVTEREILLVEFIDR